MEAILYSPVFANVLQQVSRQGLLLLETGHAMGDLMAKGIAF
jgi:hypothetical protein